MSATAAPTGGRKLIRNCVPAGGQRRAEAARLDRERGRRDRAGHGRGRQPHCQPALRVGCCEANQAAGRAIAPIATPPQPGTAVKDPLRSMVLR